MTAYRAAYPVGSIVRVADEAHLRRFRREWSYHHALLDEQVAFAGRLTKVTSVGFYHGGDPLYELEGVPGTWHEVCLEAS